MKVSCMFRWQNIGILLISLGMVSCTYSYSEEVYYDNNASAVASEYFDPLKDGKCEKSVSDKGEEITVCKYGDGKSGFWVYEKDVLKVYPQEQINTDVNSAGLTFCPPKDRCPDDRLPPRPCIQPIPYYYDNVAQKTLANAVVLIHPYTRAQAVCYDDVYASLETMGCVNHFRARGYVLITDLPQLPAKYDFLRKGTYPTRRWRNGGETVPRW